MLISIHYLIKKYNIQFEGILHVGAHECEELSDYEVYIERDKIIWVEAMPNKVEECKRIYPGINIECAVVSDKNEIIEFNVTNNGQSSSMLEFGLHKIYHPHVYNIGKFRTETKLLIDILNKYQHVKCNFLNLDIQGVELKALKGMESYLKYVKYIYTEVNTDYVYEGCTLMSELDDFLGNHGFIRMETEMTEFKWGDAFYIKNN